MINRIARIYPMFLILTTITFIVLYISEINKANFTIYQVSKNTGFLYFMNISFLKSFFYDLRFTGIPQAWTLTVEECFYFLAPFIFLSISRIKLMVQPFLFLAVGILIVKFFGGESMFGFFKNYEFMLIFTFFGRAFEFYLGIKLALMIISNKRIQFIDGKATVIGVGGIIVVLIFLSLYHQVMLPPYGRIILTSFILLLFIFSLFYGLIKEESLVKKFLSKDYMVLFGKSSYVFYLIHVGVIQIFISSFFVDVIFIFFILLNIIAIILYKSLEEPLNKYIRRIYSYRELTLDAKPI